MNPSAGDPDTRTSDRRPSGFARFLSRSRRPFKRLSFNPRPAADSSQPVEHVPPTTNPPAQADTPAANIDREHQQQQQSSQVNPDIFSEQQQDVASQQLAEVGTDSFVPQVRVVRQVKRLCHRCGISFSRAERTCQGCRHALCYRCPRDPPRSALYACMRAEQSSASDAEQPDTRHRVYERMQKKPRYRIRFTCEQCAQLFPEKRKTCVVCGHQLCEKCTRDPPRRLLNPQHPPDAVTKLQARLQAVSVPPLQVPSQSAQSSASPAAEPTPAPSSEEAMQQAT